MRHHASASKKLIVPAVLALAFAPAARTARFASSFHLDGKTGSAERVSVPPMPSDRNSGAQEAAPQTPPLSPAVAGQPMVKRPLVTYEDGELTIIAENSPLSEVMKALRACLGADIDLPANDTDQHIWVRLGPGPARRVLRDLLDGTEFNYVIQASESDPSGIRSVLLTPRSKSPGAEPAPPGRTAIRRMPGHESDAQSSTESESPASEPVASVDPAPAAAPTAPAAAAASAAAAPVNASSVSLQYTPGNSASAALSPPPPTDPNQMIQTLQSMYEQRRQMQIQHDQKPAGQN